MNSPEKAELYVGIMSGTSLDGIDTALLDFSGSPPRLVATHYQPYADALKKTLLALHEPAHGELHLAQVTANDLSHEYAAATHALLHKAGASPAQIVAIGCHGQTIRHRPEAGYTTQLCNAALLAELCNITVVSDFRSRDIAAGGQGAPLVPAFHNMMLRHADTHRVIVNIGGISNLTNLAPGMPTSGFDCGPGNLLMDAWINLHLGQPYDKEGSWANSGAVNYALLKTLLEEPFFHAPPPKSCGRDLFNPHWLERQLQGNEKAADVQATLLALTVQSIGSAIKDYCAGAQEIYLCGGGAHNTALLDRLRTQLPACSIQLTDQLGIEADWMEAIAFAWLARQALHGLTASLPEVTGAQHPSILGAIYQA